MKRRNGTAGGEDKMPKMPSFADEQEAADWFAAHDTSPYMEELENVQITPERLKGFRDLMPECSNTQREY